MLRPMDQAHCWNNEVNVSYLTFKQPHCMAQPIQRQEEMAEMMRGREEERKRWEAERRVLHYHNQKNGIHTWPFHFKRLKRNGYIKTLKSWGCFFCPFPCFFLYFADSKRLSSKASIQPQRATCSNPLKSNCSDIVHLIAVLFYGPCLARSCESLPA